MAYLIPLFILFISALLPATRKTRTSSSLYHARLWFGIPSPSPDFLSGILRKAAEKTGLIALFLILSPRRSRIAPRQLKLSSETTEILELFLDCETRPENADMALTMLAELDSPLQWTMRYAYDYYSEMCEEIPLNFHSLWESYIQGMIMLEGNAAPDVAEPLLRRATGCAFMPAYAALGDLYFGQCLWDKALQALAPTSKAAYPPALHSHGRLVYLSTLGNLFQHKRMTEAFGLFSAAAAQGYPPAMAVLGEMYLKGYGTAVTADLSTALYYLEAAYKGGVRTCAPLLVRARAAEGERRLYPGSL